MAMGGIDNHHIAFGGQQRLGALKACIAHGGGGGHAQAPGGILGGVGVIHRLFDILDGNQPHAMIGIIHHQQLFDAAGMQQAPCLFLRHAGGNRGQILMGHQLAHRLGRVGGKAHIAVGKDADKPPPLFHHGNAGNAVNLHQGLRLAQRGIRRDGDGVHHHTAFKALHRAHRGALLLDGKVAVQHANAAHLRHHNGHIGLGHRVHRSGNDGDVQRDTLGQAGARISHARHDVRLRRPQQNVIKGQTERDVHKRHFCLQG